MGSLDYSFSWEPDDTPTQPVSQANEWKKSVEQKLNDKKIYNILLFLSMKLLNCFAVFSSMGIFYYYYY